MKRPAESNGGHRERNENRIADDRQLPNPHPDGTQPADNHHQHDANNRLTHHQTTAAAALDGIALGYRVLRLRPNSKIPATEHGLRDATMNPAAVATWPTDCNIGIAPGADVLVLDFDVPKDDRPEPDRRREALHNLHRALERFPELATAPIAATPSGGWHVWVRLPEAQR